MITKRSCRRLDRLVISLDSTDPALWSEIIGTAPGVAHDVLNNIRTYAARQREFGYQLVVNCVITPQTLPQARTVLDFCEEHRILISFSPQSVNNWPHYDLLMAQDVSRLRSTPDRSQTRGRAHSRQSRLFPDAGRLHALRVLSAAGAARHAQRRSGVSLPPDRTERHHARRAAVQPAQRGDVERGHRIALQEYDEPPQTCTSCFQQCFAEPSLLQAQPAFAVARTALRGFAAGRCVDTRTRITRVTSNE